MNKTDILQAVRKIGGMHLLDKLKFYYEVQKNKTANQQFLEKNPSLTLPPPYMLFEAFQMNFEKYYLGGKETTQWIIDLAMPYVSLDNATILDWGCGPARVVRHWKELMGANCSVFGTDYNEKTIDWCKNNIQNVAFEHNGVNPPTNFSDEKFDLIYGISIFTHLSEKNHHDWLAELLRITKKNGIVIITTHGDAFKEKLTSAEQVLFNQNQLVVRGNVVEGHRVYAAFQPSSYLKNLFENKVEILRHLQGQKKNWGIEQDVWILKKI
jgi:ubiquinone/menaquinone biosynthesis C-methylase UbiE